jgi:hypothetical protein
MGSRVTGTRTWSIPRVRAVAAAAGLAAVLAASGCDEVGQTRLDFSTTEKVKITEIQIAGGGGGVTVNPGAAGEVRIDRVVRYRGTEPGKTYRLEGTVLHVNSDCGPRCSVTYDIHAPAGIAVRGESTSGDVTLTGVSTVDLTIRSGSARVTDATANVKVTADSGDVSLVNVAGDVTLDVQSGSVEARGLKGKATRVFANSGDVTLTLETPADVRAEAESGSVRLAVPAGSYRVDATADSGELDVRVPNDPAGRHHLQVHANSGDVIVTTR